MLNQAGANSWGRLEAHRRSIVREYPETNIAISIDIEFSAGESTHPPNLDVASTIDGGPTRIVGSEQ
jgi:hypothetical protein